MMAEEPLKHILDPQDARAQIEENLGPYLDLLREVTNYGTHLIARCFHSSAKQMPDVIALVVFLKQVVEMLDATEVLLRQSAVQPARLQARALFEASAYLEFLLKTDPERRARAYYVWNLRRQQVWARRVLKGTSEREKYELALGEHHVDHTALHPEMESEAKRLDSSTSEFLSRAEYSDLDAMFETEFAKRGYDPPWHAILGFRSLRAVCAEIGRLHEYEVFYSLDSQVAHSSSYRQHFRVQADTVVFEPLRNPEGISTLITVTLSTAFHTYRVAIRRYRPAEELAFDAKYRNEWRERFRSIPHVDVKPVLQTGYS